MTKFGIRLTDRTQLRNGSRLKLLLAFTFGFVFAERRKWTGDASWVLDWPHNHHKGVTTHVTDRHHDERRNTESPSGKSSKVNVNVKLTQLSEYISSSNNSRTLLDITQNSKEVNLLLLHHPSVRPSLHPSGLTRIPYKLGALAEQYKPLRIGEKFHPLSLASFYKPTQQQFQENDDFVVCFESRQIQSHFVYFK